MKINSNKKYVLFKVLLMLMMLNILPKTKAEVQTWCWTKSMANEPTYVFDPSKGGINWGFCEKISNEISTMRYDIEVETSSIAKSGTDSALKIQIIGHSGMTQEKVLGNSLEAGSVRKFSMDDADVGDISKIQVKISGTNGYRCRSIKITKGNSSINFQCLKRFEPCTNVSNQFICQAELLPEGDTAYEITVKSNDEDDSGTSSPILIGIVGGKGISNFQMLSESGIEAGNQVTSIVKVNDVGPVTGYQIELSEPGKWKGSYMIIKTIKNGQVNQFDLKDVALVSPGASSIKFDSSPSGFNVNPTNLSNSVVMAKTNNSQYVSDSEYYQVNSSGTIGKTSGGFNKGFELAANGVFDGYTEDDDNDVIAFFTQYSSDSESAGRSETDFTASSNAGGDNNGINVNDPNGGLILPQERRGIINLDCSQKLINPDNANLIFGPDYPTANVNYMKILARCPASCHKTQGQVYGTGIHPENSPICLSALVDRAISDYGGIIQISIFPGLEKYLINNTLKYTLIKVNPYVGHSNKSYIITKVDNLDLVEKDIRIVDAKGNLSTTGRLEVRLNAKWGTVCTLRNNEESARRICKDLGFKDGKWLSQAGQVSCQNFNGQNFCGSENYKSIFSDINCSTNDSNFSACSKKEANRNECPHLNDAIISCSNKSFESSDNTPNGALRLENVKISNGNTIGRLEYYNLSKYLPVCSNGFTPESANVACRQLGYESGEKYDDYALKFTYPADDPTAFAITQVKCNGDEASLGDCNSQSINIDCSHVLDVVLQCVGPKGDSTGKSQMKSGQDIDIPPSLGKLSLLKFKINCDTKGNDPKFRGDAGSVYLVNCPANCKKEKGSLWGLGIYTLDSSVCQAGVHAGIINDEKGGTFAYTKIWGQNYYMGNTRNGISSSELNSGFPVSFTVQALNSGWTAMWKLWKENFGGIYLEQDLDVKERDDQESKFLVNLNHDSKSKNLRNKYRSRNSHKNKISTKSENNENVSSFVELSTSSRLSTKMNLSPVFEWIEIDPSHVFSDKEGGSVMLNESTMRPLKKYQILIRVKMTDFKGRKSFIFSNGGCNNFNIYLDETDNLVFGDPCNEPMQINSNIQLALNDKTIIYAYYEESNMRVVIFSERLNKPIFKSFSKTLEIQNTPSVGIGRKSDVKDMFFYGNIDFIQIYDEEIPFAAINTVIDSINNKAKVPQPVESRNSLDKRSCISSCVNDPTPGQPGAPTPPKDADPYAQSDTNSVPLPGVDSNISGGSNASFWAQKNRLKSQGSQFTKGTLGGSTSFEGGSSLTKKMIYGIDATSSSALSGFESVQNQVTGNTSPSGTISGTNSNGISGGNASAYTYSESYIATYGTYDSSEQNNIESMNIDCETTLKDFRFSGSVGKIFRVKCASCNTVKKPVYGSFIYHPLSSICKAAAHAGTINPQFSGYIIVELVSGKKIYNGSLGSDNNISGTFSSSNISFKTKAGTPPMKITCSDAPNLAPFNSAAIGSKFVVICPQKCSISKVSIYGSEIYADMSPICLSGIHYGVISDKGGELDFLIEGSQSYFKGTKSFGVISKSRDAYVRSFRFVGVKSAIFYKFTEDFKLNINSKWLITVSDQVSNRESNSWDYQEYKMFDSSLNKYVTQPAIHHKGIIRSSDDNNYGVFVTLKNVEWNNGRVQANFLFKDSKMAVFLFRFQDKDNYYAMEMDISNLQNNLRLIAKVDGSIKIIESKFISLNLDTWYRLTLILNNDQITISIQTDKIREIKPVFEHNLELLSRGTIGFASNGNNDFYISGIEVDDFVLHSSKKIDKKNRRSWINLFKHTEPKAVKNYCKHLFGSNSNETERCLVPQNFCKLKCDDHIPIVENILNFNCYKDCLNKIGYEKNEVVKEAMPWSPQVGDKIDFSLSDDGVFVPGYVLSLQNVEEEKEKVISLSISYYDNAGNNLKAKAKFPSGSVSRCGSKLTRRKDC